MVVFYQNIQFHEMPYSSKQKCIFFLESLPMYPGFTGEILVDFKIMHFKSVLH